MGHSWNKHSLAPPQVCAYFGNAVLQGCYPTHYNLIVIWFGILCDFSTRWKSRRWKFLYKMNWLEVLLLKEGWDLFFCWLKTTLDSNTCFFNTSGRYQHDHHRKYFASLQRRVHSDFLGQFCDVAKLAINHRKI